jgi:hypothetical protein
MNIDTILGRLNYHGVQYLLIGGVNFLLRHRPVLTFDLDLWLEPEPANRRRCERALADLEAAWGPTEQEWRPAREWPEGWLDRQELFCLTSPAGAIDVFQSVRGLSAWTTCHARSVTVVTAAGTSCRALSDADMLACQLALDPADRKEDRIRALREALGTP